MDDMYREHILEHYSHPQNFGVLQNPTFSHQEFNETCGDKMTLFLKVNEEKNIVEEVSFDGKGCAISMASASLMTEKIKGMQVEDVLKLTNEDVLDELCIPVSPSRMKCALLSLKTIQYTLHEKCKEF